MQSGALVQTSSIPLVHWSRIDVEREFARAVGAIYLT